MRTLYLFFCIPLVVILCCQNKAPNDYKAFQAETIKLVFILNEISKAGITNRVVRKDGESTYFYNFKKQEKIVAENKKRILQIDKRLKQYILTHPGTIWEDDAMFCRTIAYIFIFEKFKNFFRVENNYIEQFLSNYPNFTLEGWTKETLGQYYKMFKEGVPGNIKNMISERESIKGGLYSFLIAENCLDGDFVNAKKNIRKAETEGINKYYIEMYKKMIELYKKIVTIQRNN